MSVQHSQKNVEIVSLASESSQVASETPTDERETYSYEDRLRALPANEIFQVHCPEDGEFGCRFRKGPEHEKTDRYGKKFYWG